MAEEVDLYKRASDWTIEKIANITDLDAQSDCEDWSVRDLLNHMLGTQHYFLSSARGEDASMPGQKPPDLLSKSPKADFEQARDEVVKTFGQEGVIEKTGPAIGIAFADMLLHGWDVARTTGQDATMPDGLAQAAYDVIHGRFTDEQRKGVFKPEISVGEDATPQQRLLAYTGRNPA
jgi:uncharacterized protein (TIGR03086 family)